MNLDLIPMLLVSLLLLVSGGEVQRVEVVTGGDHRLEVVADALVVTGGDVSVPADVVLDGPVHVLGGSLDVQGAVGGEVLVLGGSVRVAEDGTVAGGVRRYGGDVVVDPGGVARLSGPQIAPAGAGVVQDTVATLALATLLALLGGWWARRRPAAVRTLGDAVRGHPLITATVGALVVLTGLAVLVFMAFTLVLLPVAVVGLALGVALVAYGVVGIGGLVGRLLPVERPSRATALGVGVVVIGLRALELVPVVGDLVALAVLLTGLGAVLVTYLGLRRFTPVELPG